MPNIPTNNISLNDIHIAIGGTTGTQVSLNDTDVRAATGLTLDATYANQHGAGINSTSGGIISVGEFRNAFYNTGSVTYSLGFSIGDANFNETNDKSGQLLFVASNTSATDTYYWRIVNGSNDFLADTGSFTTTVGGGGSFTSANFFIQTVEDNLTEGTETFDVEVLDPTNTTVLASITVTVADTSITPAATYAGSFDVASINEDGSSTATFTVTTTNVVDNTTVGYTITGIDAADISLSSLTGTITITGNSGSVSFTATQDLTTEGNETVTLTLDATDSTGAATNSPSDTVVINDTSTTPAVPTYAGSFDVASINEDGSSTATFTVTTANVANGTTVGYTISGIDVADISLSSLTGTITINSNSGSVSFTAVADTTTEGNETVTLTLDATDSTGAATNSPSDTVVINDTSTTPAVPTYAIQGSDPLSINETSSATTITVNTTNVSDGTTLYWNITTDQSGSTQASTDWAAYNSGGAGFTINSNTGSFTIDALADNTTETNETYYLHVRTGSDTGTIVDSIELTVVDDSLDPPITGTITPTYLDGSRLGSAGSASASFTIGSNGDFTTTSSPIGGPVPAVSANDWAPSSDQAAGIGDDYQVNVVAYSSSSSTFGEGSVSNHSALTALGSSSNNQGGATTWDNGTGDWFRLNSNFVMTMTSSGSVGITINTRMIDITIKEFDGTNYGSGTTILEHRLKLQSSVDNS